MTLNSHRPPQCDVTPVPSLYIAMPPRSSKPRQFAWQIAPNLWLSFRYAWAGIHYAFKTQRNFRIHTVIASLAVILGVGLGVSSIELAIVALTCALVMVLELLNTALESVVDLTVQQNYHELAKIAKDCAAGAVLVAAIASILVAGLILVPPLLALTLTLFSR
ncbi:diacylglycerol kinase family protein [Spirulina sp. CCNP1310]|uniref:diacylglycerol kinase family protein n=1 Tax=Spirulina sp. CCNP1310 TaxID=3110249 RepID=UPI002B213F0A|nr:diacylglycerol kinase family protein [Spirulina sp. CCNP1310]MEA5418672.1 diacylglycerol kinase family protein [Spirulina sp. CCNP1310]